MKFTIIYEIYNIFTIILEEDEVLLYQGIFLSFKERFIVLYNRIKVIYTKGRSETLTNHAAEFTDG
jgi:hypothetical protein